MRVRVRVYGAVQGVGFRYFVREVAQASQLKGWVRNMEDGSVEALLEGAKEDVNYAVEMCRRGPPSAKVTRFESKPEDESSQLSGFRIAF